MNTATRHEAEALRGAMSGQSSKRVSREMRKRRARAVRTAWALAAVALVIFTAFILSGVLGQAQGG
jgi:uncharacterized membrane protein YidH (DUF202 family)